MQFANIIEAGVSVPRASLRFDHTNQRLGPAAEWMMLPYMQAEGHVPAAPAACGARISRPGVGRVTPDEARRCWRRHVAGDDGIGSRALHVSNPGAGDVLLLWLTASRLPLNSGTLNGHPVQPARVSKLPSSRRAPSAPRCKEPITKHFTPARGRGTFAHSERTEPIVPRQLMLPPHHGSPRRRRAASPPRSRSPAPASATRCELGGCACARPLAPDGRRTARRKMFDSSVARKEPITFRASKGGGGE